MVLGLNLADRVYAARDAEDARDAARVPEHNPDHGATLRLLDALTNSSCRQQ
jgi:hypothetical protein